MVIGPYKVTGGVRAGVVIGYMNGDIATGNVLIQIRCALQHLYKRVGSSIGAHKAAQDGRFVFRADGDEIRAGGTVFVPRQA